MSPLDPRGGLRAVGAWAPLGLLVPVLPAVPVLAPVEGDLAWSAIVLGYLAVGSAASYVAARTLRPAPHSGRAGRLRHAVAALASSSAAATVLAVVVREVLPFHAERTGDVVRLLGPLAGLAVLASLLLGAVAVVERVADPAARLGARPATPPVTPPLTPTPPRRDPGAPSPRRAARAERERAATPSTRSGKS